MTLSLTARRLALNIGTSYANVGLTALITLLVVPIYVHVLGAGQWGIVALCMTLQGLLFSVDVALGPLMLRDTARAALHGRQYSSYRRFVRLYGGFACGTFVLAQLVVTVLQHASGMALPLDAELAWAIRIVLVQFLFQFSNNAAIGYWNALEMQKFANLRLAGFTLAKHALALLLVTQWSASAPAYLAPFAVLGILEFFLNFRRVRREARGVQAVRTDPAEQAADPGAVADWRALAGFGVAAGLGVLAGQVDRIFLSLVLPAEQFGIYYLVGTLTLSLLQLQVPIHRAFLPRMATSKQPWLVVAPMLRVSLLLVALPCLVMALGPQWVLQLWLHDARIAAAGAPAFRLILTAIALISMYAPISVLLLSQHRYRTMTLINGLVLLVQLLLLFVFAPGFGIVAGGLAWLGCGVLQVSSAVFIWRASRDGHARSQGPQP